MIVQIIVDSVAPAVAPAVIFKQFLHHRGRIERAWQVDRAPIDDNRPPRVIRGFAIVAEAKHAPLAAPQQSRGLLRSRTLPAGDALSRFFQSFQQSHGPACFYKKLISAALSTAAAMQLFRWLRTPARQSKHAGLFDALLSDHKPRSFLALPPASAVTVAASKSSTAAIWPSGSYSAMS